MGLLIVFFLLSIIFSFLCSIWEAVLLSVPPAYVQIQHKEGTKTGKLLKEMKQDIDLPLAAILTLNTIAHTVGAIGVGAQAAIIWAGSYLDINLGFTVLHVNTAGVIVPTVMTLAILILSEIIPKTLGANYWKNLAGFTVRALRVIIYALWPLVWLSKWITKILKSKNADMAFSRTDFKAMAEIGVQEGVFRKGESNIIQNLMRFNTITAKDIMTPRTVVIAANEEMSISEFYQDHPSLTFSRIPIYKENKDQITGFFLKDDLLQYQLEGKGDQPLKSIKREVSVITEVISITELFNRLMEEREHIAIVVGEYGGFEGLVTMEDVIETLLGMEILDEMDNIEDMQRLARKNWEKRARALGILKDSDDN
jgi:CBS domain containing-hemolysin-like protein